MSPIAFEIIATEDNFDENKYLAANPDVADAVREARVPSGLAHFHLHGKKEKRRIRNPPALGASKREKLAKIRHLLRTDMPFVDTPAYIDFLSDELREQFNIIDTDAVSSNDYDETVLALIENHRDGMILDCGAGLRSIYYPNVVNFEIAPYDTTDVRGVGEVLPFKDNSFDAVISSAVLEHVKDPFQCAKEIIRVLKPGGDLFCAVPFLQPMHGYPHHYYNMTETGLRNLFEPGITIERHYVPDALLPIFSLQWILKSWSEGLEGKAKREFLKLKVADLLDAPASYLKKPWVRELSEEKNFEIAAGTVITGRKV
jgi:SAM-dependent methyltransferase